jgi:hypothetical protein
MSGFLRRLRGAIGLSLTWGAVWAALFVTLFLVIAALDPRSIDQGETLSLGAAIGAAYGFVTGVSFSALLLIAERRRTLRDIPLARVALWGAIAAAVMPLASLPADNRMIIFMSPISAALAVGMMALARRADRRAESEPDAIPA